MSGKYIPALDGLRALSVLAVMFTHLNVGYSGGFLGVDIFFVLSGFLITTILLENAEAHGRIRFAQFYARRARRLLPAIVAMLVLVACWAHFRNIEVSKPSLATLFYYANWPMCTQGPTIMGPLAHTWSLSIEEQFYLAWPVLLLVLLRFYSTRISAAKAVFVLVGVLAVLRIVLYCVNSPLASYYSTLARVDGILMGCACALWTSQSAGAAEFWSGRRGTLIAWACAGTVLVLTFFMTTESDFLFVGGFSIIALYAAALILHLSASRSGVLTRLLENKFLVAIGKRSYGIYLYHFPVFIALQPLRSSNEVWNLVGLSCVKLGAALAVAWISYRYLELPFLKGSRVHGAKDGAVVEAFAMPAEQRQSMDKAA